jgi:predicted enzyme related to lactoylglutathione lyase
MGDCVYTQFQADGRTIAGGMDMHFLPDDIPPHWMMYFTVENAEETARRVPELGGTVMDGPKPTALGPIVVISDPVGAAFIAIELTEKPS